MGQSINIKEEVKNEVKRFLLKSIVLILLFVAVVSSNATNAAVGQNEYIQRFFELYETIHNYKVTQKMPDGSIKTVGYFSPGGVPYHAFETFLCEAPDYGHETTSETYSYYLWLEAMYLRLTRDYKPFQTAWKSMEDNIIPGAQDQPVANGQVVTIGRYAKQTTDVKDYPVLMYAGSLDSNRIPFYFGDDPLAVELANKYGNQHMYGMHWLLDTDNFYGFGYRGDESSDKPVYLATCERGGSESSWNTIPHPNWKNRVYGNNTGNTNGFGDIFLNSPYGWSEEYSYSVATDADARAIQAAYMAAKTLASMEHNSYLRHLSEKTAKMGDFLRYGMRTKYHFPLGRKIKEEIEKNPNKNEYDHTITILDPSNKNGYIHYLLGWNYAWGAAIPDRGGYYPWRIGDDNVHAAYQNPVAAYALSRFEPFSNAISGNGKNEWNISLNRQLELIRWLQTKQGAIGGGITNCWNGDYRDPNLVPEDPSKKDPVYPDDYKALRPGDPGYVNSFYDMYYTHSPVYVGRDPISGNADPKGDSNAWIGWQVWLMQRLAELYHEVDTSTHDGGQLKYKLELILDQWIPWIMREVVLDPSATDPMSSILLPSEFTWVGQPETNWPNRAHSFPLYNPNYEVQVGNETYKYADISITGNLARTLIYYAAGKRKHTGNPIHPLVVTSRNMAKNILDLIYTNYKTERGFTNEYETRDYVDRFFEAKVYVPETIVKSGGYETEEREGALPANMGAHRAGSRYGNVTSKLRSSGGEMTFDEIRAKFEENPGPQGPKDISYSKLMIAYNDPDKKDTVPIRYHRFFSQVEIALAFAEFGLFFGDESSPRNDRTFGPLTIDMQAASEYGVYGTAHTDFHDRAALYLVKGSKSSEHIWGRIGVGTDYSNNPQMIIGYAAWVGDVVCGQPNLWLRGPNHVGNILAANEIRGSFQRLWEYGGPYVTLDYLRQNNPNRDLGFLHLTFDKNKCWTNNNNNVNVPSNGSRTFSPYDVYGDINIGGRATVTFAGGVYYCNNFRTEPDAILNFNTSNHPVIIIAKESVDIKSRTQMKPTNDDASKVLIIAGTDNTVYISPQVKWLGTIIAPNSNYLNVDLGWYDSEGAFIGKSVVIHQSTSIVQVPFNYDLLSTNIPGYRDSYSNQGQSNPSSNSSSNWWSSWSWW